MRFPFSAYPRPAVSAGTVILCLAISWVGLFDRDLWTPDEPREAAIMLEMARSGDVLVPRLAGEPFVEKPPLYYATGAAVLRGLAPVLGPIAALRLTSALWGLAALGFTALLARRLLGKHGNGAVAAAALATMPGFVWVTHWLLVDNALLALSTAALWAAAEAYLGRRYALLPLSALGAAGAFLSKGAIGPLILAVAWLGLAIPWWRGPGRVAWRRPGVLWSHAVAAVLFAGLALGWMLAFRKAAGPDLWREWFWQNHVGRLTGAAGHLGHRQGPLYYLWVLPAMILPWLAPVGAWLGGLMRRAWRRTASPADVFLAAWALGGVLLLSVSATKRDIYLAVLLPAFALAAADRVRLPDARWLRVSLRAWGGVLSAAAAALLVAPAFGPWTRAALGGWDLRRSVAGALLGLSLLADWRSARPPLDRAVRAMALGLIVGIGLLVRPLDSAKGYGPAFRDLAARLPAEAPQRLASWNFDETTRAGFYFYCTLVFPRLSGISNLLAVVQGRHPTYTGVIALAKDGQAEAASERLPGRVRAEVRMGRRRIVRWIEGSATGGGAASARPAGHAPSPPP